MSSPQIAESDQQSHADSNKSQNWLCQAKAVIDVDGPVTTPNTNMINNPVDNRHEFLKNDDPKHGLIEGLGIRAAAVYAEELFKQIEVTIFTLRGVKPPNGGSLRHTVHFCHVHARSGLRRQALFRFSIWMIRRKRR